MIQGIILNTQDLAHMNLHNLLYPPWMSPWSSRAARGAPRGRRGLQAASSKVSKIWGKTWKNNRKKNSLTIKTDKKHAYAWDTYAPRPEPPARASLSPRPDYEIRRKFAPLFAYITRRLRRARSRARGTARASPDYPLYPASNCCSIHQRYILESNRIESNRI